jgi:hypothetical protein
LPPKRTVILFSAAVALVYAVWALRTGVRVAVDTPTYSQWADALIALGFNPAAYLRTQQFVAPPILYLAWVAVVALLKTILGASWMTGVVVLNVIALTAGATATIDAIRRVTQSGAGMLLAVFLFLAAGDLLLFVPYVLSDVMFWGLSTMVLACGVVVVSEEGAAFPARAVIAGSALLAVAFVFRPTALPLVAFWIIVLATRVAAPLVDRFATPLLVTALAVAVALVFADAYVMHVPSAWPFGSYPALLTMVRDEYRIGMFVHQASPPMLVDPPAGVLGFARITLEKLMFFITPWLPHYSRSHVLINLLFFTPAYILSIASISNLRRLAPAQQRAVFVLALFVLGLSVFHAILLIDSDYRYRLPMLPALITLAAIGLESVRRPRTLASIARKK